MVLKWHTLSAITYSFNEHVTTFFWSVRVSCCWCWCCSSLTKKYHLKKKKIHFKITRCLIWTTSMSFSLSGRPVKYKINVLTMASWTKSSSKGRVKFSYLLKCDVSLIFLSVFLLLCVEGLSSRSLVSSQQVSGHSFTGKFEKPKLYADNTRMW